MNRVQQIGFGLVLLVGKASVSAAAQESGATAPPEIAPLPLGEKNPAGDGVSRPAGPAANQRVRPISEGPLHEAFLSPRKDREPTYVPKSPPRPIGEKPAIDPPSDRAEWIEGYWEWDEGRKDYVWVTGTWRSTTTRPVLGQWLLESPRSRLVSRPRLLE